MGSELPSVNRRCFVAAAFASLSATVSRAQDTTGAPGGLAGTTTLTPPPRDLPPEQAPFAEPLSFQKADVALRLRPFPMTAVRVTGGSYQIAQEANLAVLKRTRSDRLLHNFRLNAGVASTAEPLGGWEKPDSELRGHYTGHFLSACGL